MALRLSGLRAARRLRSLHFVPGGSQKFLDKALASRADALIIDLEDSVLPAEKPAARADVARWMSSIQWGQKTVCVRINPLDTSLWEEDVELTMKAEKPDMLVVPKVSSRDELEKLGEKLTEMERKLGRELGRTTLSLCSVNMSFSTSEKICAKTHSRNCGSLFNLIGGTTQYQLLPQLCLRTVKTDIGYS